MCIVFKVIGQEDQFHKTQTIGLCWTTGFQRYKISVQAVALATKTVLVEFGEGRMVRTLVLLSEPLDQNKERSRTDSHHFGETKETVGKSRENSE